MSEADDLNVTKFNDRADAAAQSDYRSANVCNKPPRTAVEEEVEAEGGKGASYLCSWPDVTKISECACARTHASGPINLCPAAADKDGLKPGSR